MSALVAVPRVPVVTRSEAGIPTRPGASPLGTARGIVVHHPAQGYGYAARPDCTEDAGIRAVRAVFASHRHGGWNDIGYHLLIDGAGRVYQGREYVRPGSLGPGRTPPGLALGSHTRNFNTGQIGVCVLGCFGGGPKDKGCDDIPSEAAMDSLTQLLTALCLAYDVRPATIIGHRDAPGAATVCPGRHLYARLGQIRGAVASAVGHAR